MPRIPSANPDFKQVNVDDPHQTDTGYTHPAETRKGGIPMAFQVTSPFNRSRILLPHSLVLHVNPTSISETFTQKIERFQTRGGWVEQHWGSELTEISVDMQTGAFMNIYTGLTSVLRQRTIAWDRYRDLHDLYRNNGSLYDPSGAIVLQGHIMLMYDRGTYIGTFRSFETEETDESPFAFKLSWAFKVEHTVLKISDIAGPRPRAPAWQSLNLPAATTPGPTQEEQAAAKLASQGVGSSTQPAPTAPEEPQPEPTPWEKMIEASEEETPKDPKNPKPPKPPQNQPRSPNQGQALVNWAKGFFR